MAHKMLDNYKNAFDNLCKGINDLKNVTLKKTTNSVKLSFKSKCSGEITYSFALPQLDKKIASMRFPMLENLKGVEVKLTSEQGDIDFNEWAYDIHVATSMMLNQSSYQYMFHPEDVTADTYMTLHQVNKESDLGKMFCIIFDNENEISVEKLNTFIRGTSEDICRIAEEYGINLSNEKAEEAQLSFKHAAYVKAQILGCADKLFSKECHIINYICGFYDLYEKLKEINDKIDEDSTYVPDLSRFINKNGDKLAIYALSSLMIYKALGNYTITSNSIEIKDEIYNKLGKETSVNLNKNQMKYKNYETKYKDENNLNMVTTCYQKYILQYDDLIREEWKVINEQRNQIYDYNKYRLFYCLENGLNEEDCAKAAFKSFKFPNYKIKYDGEIEYKKGKIDVEKLDFKNLQVISNEDNQIKITSFGGFLSSLNETEFSNTPALKIMSDREDGYFNEMFAKAYQAAEKYTKNNKLDGTIDLIGLDYIVFKEEKKDIFPGLSDEVKRLKKQRYEAEKYSFYIKCGQRSLIGVPDKSIGYMDFGVLAEQLCDKKYADNPIRETDIKMQLFEALEDEADIIDSHDVSDEMLAKFLKNAEKMSYKNCKQRIESFFRYIFEEDESEDENEYEENSYAKTVFALNDYLLMMKTYNVDTAEDEETILHDICVAYKTENSGVVLLDEKRRKCYDVEAGETSIYRPRTMYEAKVLNYFFRNKTASLLDVSNKGQGSETFYKILEECEDRYLSQKGHTMAELISDLKKCALSNDSYSSHNGIDIIEKIKQIENKKRGV